MTSPEKKNSRLRYRSRIRRKNLWILLLILVSCTVVWGGLFYLSQLGPRKVASQPEKNSNQTAEPTKPASNSYAGSTAEELMEISIELENEAQMRMDSGDYEIASSRYAEAAQLQRNINRNYPLSRYGDASRVMQLKLQAKNAAAEPLFAESLGHEQQAERFVEAGDFDLAKEALGRAIDIQQQLNKEHRDAHQASISRLQQLKSRLAKLESEELAAEIAALTEWANSLDAFEESEEAARLLQEAILLQEQLNKNFPESSHASTIRVGELKKQEQVVKSASLAQELEEQSSRLAQALGERKTAEAGQLLAELKKKLQVFEETFPLSTLIGSQLEEKIAYLYQKEGQLQNIQNEVYAALIPVPDSEGVRMLSTEVPQSLYLKLMDSNPSRNPGDLNPVDSVSWTGASDFCKRMSWILGKEVRLPVEDEFRRALSGFNPEEAGGSIRSAATAGGNSQPTGQTGPLSNGYFDLLGNVSEWLTSGNSSESNTAYHIGGSAQDSLETILKIPVRSLQKTERNRMTGFRIVVLD